MSRSLAFVSTLAVGGLVACSRRRRRRWRSMSANLDAGLISGVITVRILAVPLLALGDRARLSGAASLLIAGQLVISVAADRLGWFGVPHVGLRAGRWVGILRSLAARS